jgi:hypothetical protein
MSLSFQESKSILSFSPFEKTYSLEKLGTDTGNWQNSAQVVGTKYVSDVRIFFAIKVPLGPSFF